MTAFSAPHPDGWLLTPEGAAVHAGERTAVIADVHLGYEWARAARGDVVPPHSLEETLRKLASLCGRADLRRVVVAGDLVESPHSCRRTERDVRALRDWLGERGLELVWLRGDHDPRHAPLPLSFEVDGWTICHGNRRIGSRPTILGHHHPILRAGGISAPCFVVGPATIVLPAFSPNAAGCPVHAPDWPESLGGPEAHCVAAIDDELLDFGPLKTLRRSVRAC
jgi:putative SbcD/Mre11-related phosphoesterase